MTAASGQYPVNRNQYSVISREALEEWLDGAAQTRRLIAPRKVEGVLLYRQVQASHEIAWGFTRPVMSAKEFFFPPTERLLTIEKNGRDIHLNETLPDDEIVLFGLRPCDAHGIKLLDALFIDTKPADPYYLRRREQTILIGLACKEMGETCFCTSVGGAPDDGRDMDIMLHETENGYLATAITEEGKTLIADCKLKITDLQPAPITNPQLHILDPQSITWLNHFNDDYWQKISERCLSCRACAYVCPTCRCFAVRDEMTTKPNQFERIRCWDSCAGENYRRLAGGHQPRPKKGERLRNRLYCKFYYYPEQYGLGTASACTGCGRCIDACPVGVDLTEVLNDLGRRA